MNITIFYFYLTSVMLYGVSLIPAILRVVFIYLEVDLPLYGALVEPFATSLIALAASMTRNRFAPKDTLVTFWLFLIYIRPPMVGEYLAQFVVINLLIHFLPFLQHCTGSPSTCSSSMNLPWHQHYGQAWLCWSFLFSRSYSGFFSTRRTLLEM